ncbi:glycoside hydrolase family 99-like domain-containing protein [Pengzhenrongella sp.]|jgi:lipopolysaccharide biosynthesis protein|uniref:glycosyltransferase WbsX family protein n=1 Tax=Pengzhenrongella sp. TaxID=2888820 RepID=UPI002F94DDAA
MHEENSQGPRTVAFYLPQFHTIDENDEWWGRGFTEWTNVRRAAPLFVGHDQPRVPAELGYYDLSDPTVVHKQAALAAANGIDAFCMYFYWFNGARLLEKPVENYLSRGPDFPFCLSWANENWTRRWDGKDHEILMAQDYREDTAASVFKDLLPYLVDPRYLRKSGAAVLVVHRADQLPGGDRFARLWRDEAERHGVGPLWLIAAETTPGLDPRPLGFDAVAEFPPVGANTLGAAHLTPIAGLDEKFGGRLLSYDRIAKKFQSRRTPSGFIRHGGVMPGWDNSARRGTRATVYVGGSPARYARWLRAARMTEVRLRGSEGLVFINAWNEWAEGAYLEPDSNSGSSYLEASRLVPPDDLSTAAPLQRGLPSLAYSRSVSLTLLSSMLSWVRAARIAKRNVVGQ